MGAILSPEMLRRLKSLVPRNWIAEFTINPANGLPVAPVANAVLGGIADAVTWVRAQGQIIRAQTRRAGTTGWLLDLDAYGFFGALLPRKPNESDDSFRKRYEAEIFRLRVTRAAIDKALFDLTGRHPDILEMFNTGDTGGYGVSSMAYGGGNPVAPRVGGYGSTVGGYGQGQGQEGYNVPSNPVTSSPGAGRYGSIQYPFQVFITAYRPMSTGISLIAGYGSTVGGYGRGTIEYADLSQVQSTVTDAEIYACVARIVAGAITAWVAIKS